jgi:hypothetical protein
LDEDDERVEVPPALAPALDARGVMVTGRAAWDSGDEPAPSRSTRAPGKVGRSGPVCSACSADDDADADAEPDIDTDAVAAGSSSPLM